MRTRWIIPLFILAAVIALTQAPRLLQMAPASPAIGGPFTLLDQQGRTVHDTDFRGKLMLIYFGYTFCPDLCPTTLSQVAEVYRDLPAEQQAQIVPIFITVDPERDTVEQMAQYVPSFSPSLVGLTGSQEQVGAVLKAYHVYARKAGSGENYGVDHSSILYLMNKDGRFLRHFDSSAKNQEIKDGIAKALAG